jgi:AraC-like DNA-binding protein
MVTPKVETSLALKARDWLSDRLHDNIGLSDMAQALEVDRFRLSREFQSQFGLPPHAWLIQLRLTHARRLLAEGVSPANVAAQLGFADQSHLGRWFRRAYQLTPARYQQGCTPF